MAKPIDRDAVIERMSRVIDLAGKKLAKINATCHGAGSIGEDARILMAAIAKLESNYPLYKPFQSRVNEFVIACFGEDHANNIAERNHRFLEEAIELVQSTGCTQDEAHQLVDYVFGRPVGEPYQEVGGVMVTLAALCSANGLSMVRDGETELARVWTVIEKIRAKQAAKPRLSPLPGARVEA